ncbi:uncharacterized protein EI97DRAFT_40285 [Westerdykella ornata]|uniref:Mmc1 C-terminal domain-containing protein n=1 Tax=Westerdykella ornata TaxID=318751 RepID=A0A6A6JK05_WESOR|nr:uncharacterized protein EI97DRAFT_40285 [Westerdykella ornata]KAF2276453.1 hypothetical protein EI97DRAFT_40285 [Westerdykella ornata]
MPPWVASVPRCSCFPRGRAIGRPLRSLAPYNWPQFNTRFLRRQYATTLVSPTAINARPDVPSRNQELYNALTDLHKTAEQYVNLSRVQLALRGLAAQEPVMRIAVLSMDSQLHAQNLARLLLADPLGSVAQWEKELERLDIEEKPVLLRFGEETDAPSTSPLYKVLMVPSPTLKSHNLEVLVSTLNVEAVEGPLATTRESAQDAVLVPKLRATSARGLPVPYPVHKTLVAGQGLDRAVSYGRFTADSPTNMGSMIKVAIDLPPLKEEPQSDAATQYSVINTNVGSKALTSFRESIANSAIYEQGWFRSGLPNLTQWLTHGLQPSEPIKPAMKAFIGSILNDTEATIMKEDALELEKLSHSLTPKETALSILNHLATWAELSHTELRDQLDAAFVARNWHKLSWWKLFWRVDDVTMITSEILEQRWLVGAEKRGIFLAGRMDEASYPNILEYPQNAVLEQGLPEPYIIESSVSEKPPQQSSGTVQTALSTEVRPLQPWHAQISTARTSLIQETIPPLQALAQRLVLNTLSTTSLTSALSALLYVSMPTISLFEAGAVAALGLVYSLRRMQKQWEDAREMWAVCIREEGRRTLKATEEGVRWIIKSKDEKSAVDDEGVKERKAAREAVRRAREALGRL